MLSGERIDYLQDLTSWLYVQYVHQYLCSRILKSSRLPETMEEEPNKNCKNCSVCVPNCQKKEFQRYSQVHSKYMSSDKRTQISLPALFFREIIFSQKLQFMDFLIYLNNLRFPKQILSLLKKIWGKKKGFLRPWVLTYRKALLSLSSMIRTSLLKRKADWALAFPRQVLQEQFGVLL